jgi:hypothetical protein
LLTLIGLERVVATASGLSEAVAWEFSRSLVEAVGEMIVNPYRHLCNFAEIAEQQQPGAVLAEPVPGTVAKAVTVVGL